MSKFIVVYLKCQQTKNGELIFEGPMLGPISANEKSAEEDAKKIVSSMPRFAIMPKIYELIDAKDHLEILQGAVKHFEILKNHIHESREIMNRPIHRSKKKKK